MTATKALLSALRGGIDLGGTKIEAIVVDDGQQVCGSARRPTPTTGGPADVAQAMVGAMREAARAAGIETRELPGSGSARPAASTPARHGLERPQPARLGRQIRARRRAGRAARHRRSRSATTCQVATTAEFELGAGKPYQSILGVFWGTGVGGGLILTAAPFHGRGGAGEIGHMVVKRDGRRCPCGNRGCIEAYAGRLAMESRARKLIEEGTRSKLCG